MSSDVIMQQSTQILAFA